MCTLLLQQSASIIALSEKINWTLRKNGLPEEVIAEISMLEKAMEEAGFKQMLKDYAEELKYLAAQCDD
jgi:hypothetical protein